MNDIRSSKTELLPCPFCGDSDVEAMQSRASANWIDCNGCNAEGPVKPTPAAAAQAWNAVALLATEPKGDGFTDALAQALYGHDPGAVRCAMKHADDIVGDTMDAHALRRLAEEVRRLRAAQPPSVKCAECEAELRDGSVAFCNGCAAQPPTVNYTLAGWLNTTGNEFLDVVQPPSKPGTWRPLYMRSETKPARTGFTEELHEDPVGNQYSVRRPDETEGGQ